MRLVMLLYICTGLDECATVLVGLAVHLCSMYTYRYKYRYRYGMVWYAKGMHTHGILHPSHVISKE